METEIADGRLVSLESRLPKLVPVFSGKFVTSEMRRKLDEFEKYEKDHPESNLMFEFRTLLKKERGISNQIIEYETLSDGFSLYKFKLTNGGDCVLRLQDKAGPRFLTVVDEASRISYNDDPNLSKSEQWERSVCQVLFRMACQLTEDANWERRGGTESVKEQFSFLAFTLVSQTRLPHINFFERVLVESYLKHKMTIGEGDDLDECLSGELKARFLSDFKWILGECDRPFLQVVIILAKDYARGRYGTGDALTKNMLANARSICFDRFMREQYAGVAHPAKLKEFALSDEMAATRQKRNDVVRLMREIFGQCIMDAIGNIFRENNYCNGHILLDWDNGLNEYEQFLNTGTLTGLPELRATVENARLLLVQCHDTPEVRQATAEMMNRFAFFSPMVGNESITAGELTWTYNFVMMGMGEIKPFSATIKKLVLD